MKIIGFILATALLTGCASAQQEISVQLPRYAYTSSCTIQAQEQAYTVVIWNKGTESWPVTRFSIAFLSHGAQAGSDTEPGNGYVNGIASIGMNDWLMPGGSVIYHVHPNNGLYAPEGCQVLAITRGS